MKTLLITLSVFTSITSQAQSWGNYNNNMSVRTLPPVPTYQAQPVQQPTYITPTYGGGYNVQQGARTTHCTQQYGGGMICN